MLSNLPHEQTFHIAEYLDVKSVINLSKTSRYFNDFSKDQLLWKTLFVSKFQNINVYYHTFGKNPDWRELFIRVITDPLLRSKDFSNLVGCILKNVSTNFEYINDVTRKTSKIPLLTIYKRHSYFSTDIDLCIKINEEETQEKWHWLDMEMHGRGIVHHSNPNFYTFSIYGYFDKDGTWRYKKWAPNISDGC